MPLPTTIRQIVLTGFMGAGKSTIGPLLAQILGWKFVDIDSIIEAGAGKTVSEIFAQQGEAHFRELEALTIQDYAAKRDVVVALGGGAIETESTRELLARFEHLRMIFLDAPLDVLVARCLAQPAAAERPVLADRKRLSQRLQARLPYYSAAHLTITTAGLTPRQVVDLILEKLDKNRALHATREGISAK